MGNTWSHFPDTCFSIASAENFVTSIICNLDALQSLQTQDNGASSIFALVLLTIISLRFPVLRDVTAQPTPNIIYCKIRARAMVQLVIEVLHNTSTYTYYTRLKLVLCNSIGHNDDSKTTFIDI